MGPIIPVIEPFFTVKEISILALTPPNDFETFTDRGKALQLAINNLTEGDILVVLGKGRENYQEIDGKKVFYSDIEIIQGFINAN